MKKIFFAGILLALLSFAFISNTNRTITGTIKDEKGNKITGATITAKGTKITVASDVNGKFSLTVDDKINTLEVSAVGYKTGTIKLTDKSDYTVILKAQTSNLNEVVVTGYGISADAVSVSSLQGKAAGVYIRGYKSIKYASPRIIKDEEDKNDENGSWRYNNDFSTEGYDHIVENPFLKTNDNPLSTFSIDVDAASYANVRRFINEGELPPAGAVRIEELINYFNYNYPQPQNDEPFSINT
jgi:Ca-activated chloride channel family protein